MLHKHAAYDDGTSGGKCQRRGWLMDMLDGMQTGRVQGSTATSTIGSRNFGRRKEGKVVKEGDDLMSATRYAVMMLRRAAVPTDRVKRIVDRPMGEYAWMR